MTFFTRIDGLTLTPGNKTAGFLLAISTPAARVLSSIPASPEELQRLHADAWLRIRNSGLMSGNRLGAAVEECGLDLLDGSSLPRYFWVNRMFATCLGGESSELNDITDPARVKNLGPEILFSPHNCDVPQHALVLLILVQTWAEWAEGRLLVAENQLQLMEKEHEQKSSE